MTASANTIAIIGCGNLGGALAEGLIRHKIRQPGEIAVFDTDPAKTERLKHLGVTAAGSLPKAVAHAAVVILAVKPGPIRAVIAELAAVYQANEQLKRPLIISIAAGVSCRALNQASGRAFTLVRVMPNLPCVVGAGLCAVYAEDAGAREVAAEIFGGVGKIVLCEKEEELDVATAIGASAPAFIFVAADALADAGVMMGLTREKSLKMVAQMIVGAGAMLSEEQSHPCRLKEMVTSPAGTTIAGLAVLEEYAFRSALIEAASASVIRAREIREENE